MSSFYQANEFEQLATALPETEIDHADAERDADLRRRQPDSGSGIHRRDEFVEQLPHRLVHLRDRRGRSLQIGGPEPDDRPERQADPGRRPRRAKTMPAGIEAAITPTIWIPIGRVFRALSTASAWPTNEAITTWPAITAFISA